MAISRGPFQCLFRALMGPRPEGRGNRWARRNTCCAGVLQWSRTPKDAETPQGNARYVGFYELQWGRAFGDADTTGDGRTTEGR